MRTSKKLVHKIIPLHVKDDRTRLIQNSKIYSFRDIPIFKLSRLDLLRLSFSC